MTAARPRSQCAVALLADIPGTGHLGDAQAHRFTLTGPDLATRCAAFIDFAQAQVAAGRKVLALYPEWRDTTALRAIRFARGSLGSDDIAAVGLNASPLTFSLLADQLAYLAPYLPAGMVASVARELPMHLVSGGWLRSVTKLAALPTSLGQHLGSYSPGSAFLAVCAPEPRVVRVRNEDATAGIPFRPVDPVQVLVSSPPTADTTPFDDRLRPALRPVSVRTLPEQPLGTAFFGTTKYVEFVALSAHPSALTQAVNNVRAIPCGWCREPTNAPVCPFCGAANTQPSGRPPARGRQLPAAPPGPQALAAPAHAQARPAAPARTGPHRGPEPNQTGPAPSQPAQRPGPPQRPQRPQSPQLPQSPQPGPAQSEPARLGRGAPPPEPPPDTGGLPLMAPSGQFRSEPMRPAQPPPPSPPPASAPAASPAPSPPPAPLPAPEAPDDSLPDPTPLPPETGTR